MRSLCHHTDIGLSPDTYAVCQCPRSMLQRVDLSKFTCWSTGRVARLLLRLPRTVALIAVTSALTHRVTELAEIPTAGFILTCQGCSIVRGSTLYQGIS